MAYTHDEFDRLTGVSVDNNGTSCYTYEYGANGNAARVTDANLGRILETEYDLADRPCRNTIKDTSGNIVYRSTLAYDKLSNLVQVREEANNAATGVRVTDFTYDRDNRVSRAQFASSANYRVDNTYDALGRMSRRTMTNVSSVYTTDYTYVGGGYGTNSTTPMVSGITQSGMNFAYAYDSRGNITAESRNGATTSYVYDGIGQLVRVNDPHENATWVYNYDRGGNITSKVKYAYTTGTLGAVVQTISYTYDSVWKDKLTNYNGAAITYDAIGNPLSDGTWTYTWEKGRQLKQMSKSGTTIQFKYDHNGIRTQKVVNVNGTITTTNYIYNGKRLVHLTQGGNWVHFYYDGQSPAMVNLNGTLYTYIKNLQGDIVGILNNAGSIVVEYKYDAWGRLLSTTGSMAGTLGLLNPFRYRGYIFDEETNLYYLMSRFYDSKIQRFVTTDSALYKHYTITNNNIYAYCSNNPTNYNDAAGHAKTWIQEWYAFSGNCAFIAMPPEGKRDVTSRGLSHALSVEGVKKRAPVNNLIDAFFSAVNISLKLGIGAGGTIKVGDVKLSCEYSCNVIDIECGSDGDFKTGPSTRLTAGAEMPFSAYSNMQTGVELGMKIDVTETQPELIPIYDGTDTITLFEFSYYKGIGGGISINMNKNAWPNIMDAFADFISSY